MNVYQMNECDTVCANSEAEAREFYTQYYDDPELIEECRQLTSSELKSRTMYVDEAPFEVKLFEEVLSTVSEVGLFSSTEY